MDVVYQTYKEELPQYMAGYTGHIPTVQKEEFVNQIVHTKQHSDDLHVNKSETYELNCSQSTYGLRNRSAEKMCFGFC